MKLLQHVVDIDHAYLTWQPPEQPGGSRTRRVVAEIRASKLGATRFRYLKDSDEYRSAVSAGFRGYPAFKIDKEEHIDGVLEAFVRRLPPRSREDFREYLLLHRLPYPFTGSDLTLLSYTGAKLPSDGFVLTPDFQRHRPPIDYLLEVAGFRYAEVALSELSVGDEVTFEVDVDNPVDKDAIMVLHRGRKIGYVNRAMRKSFNVWLTSFRLGGTIARLNGKPERPLVYVEVRVRDL